MKKIGICFLLSLFLPLYAFGAQVFGSLKYGRGSVGQGAEIRIQCGENEKPAQATTDTYGSYSVFVRRSGRCKLTVGLKGKWTEPFYIYSDATDPVRYDFELLNVNGALTLRRR